MAWFARNFATDPPGVQPADILSLRSTGSRTLEAQAGGFLRWSPASGSSISGNTTQGAVYAWTTPGVGINQAQARLRIGNDGSSDIQRGGGVAVRAQADRYGYLAILTVHSGTAASLGIWRNNLYNLSGGGQGGGSVGVTRPADGGWVWVKLKVTTNADNTVTAQAKAWLEGETEPDWLLTFHDTANPNDPDSGCVTAPGYVGMYATNKQLSSTTDFDAFSAGEFVLLPDPLDRIRSGVSETAGDILVDMQAVDVGASEAFLHRPLDLGQPIAYNLAIRPGEVTHVFYPRRKLPEEALDSYQYETKLARLNRTYPETVRMRSFSTPESPALNWSGRQWLEWLFAEWAAIYPWFTYEPVPGMFLRVATSIDNNLGTLLNPRVHVLALEQSKDSPRRSMRSFLDDILEVFQGYTLRVNAANNFVIVPPPWAVSPAPAPLALTYADLYTSLNPEIDAESVVNRATVRSQEYAFVPDQVVMQPAAARIKHSNAPDYTVDEAQFVKTGHGVSYTHTWPVDPNTFIGTGKPLSIGYTAYAKYQRDSGTVLDASSVTVTPVEPTLPLDGAWHHILFLDARGTTPSGVVMHGNVRLEGRYVAACGVVELRWYDAYLRGTHWTTTESVLWSFMLELNGTAEAWTRSGVVNSGTFGLAGDVMPAMSESQAQFGIVEATINSNVFSLDARTCELVAEGYVRQNAEPKRRYNLEQSVWNAYPVTFASLGRLVDLPNGERGVIEAVDYADAFEYDSAFIQSRFTAVVTANLIDPTLEYLRTPSGEFVLTPNGEFINHG